ncbi:hypothetical protein D3879_14785 [Pseudomonas cavernicola]|uniref:Uncharacterized protein n=2 Tax=Pseudomonas cavernicola TaxID=2320866 RepID=A0A418XEI7_9PSED|nr:hypothetical protein D3879_14785 [Pseudomonas cavernicola]
MTNPLTFLAALRGLHPDLARYGRNGGCYRVYLALQQVFPNAQPYYDGDHVLTKIDEHFYDIGGSIEPGTHRPMSAHEQQRTQFWQPLPALSAEQALQEANHGR